ncbi:MAG TPA: hypothetical protein DCK93_06785 [Blastocatellia bacterium]|jgi:hypothetical protein|nr:hypothetical protein [Blastocatellia bacterium]
MPSSDDFEQAYREPLSKILDHTTWNQGDDLAEAYERMEREITNALNEESRYHEQARRTLLKNIGTAPGTPHNAGVYQVKTEQLEKIHTSLLFNGGVEACDGTYVIHDTLPLTITQIGVSLVKYNGQHNSWVQRLFRRDLQSKMSDPVDELATLLENRKQRAAQGQDDDKLSELASRGIMAFMERKILQQASDAPWRMMHGSPAPYEILTGRWASDSKKIAKSLELIEWYALEHKRFISIPSAPRKLDWLTLGYALKPMEFAIVHTIQPEIEHLLETGGYRNASGVRPAMERFARDVAPHIVIGVYRVSAYAPPHLFYAQIDFAEKAAHIAMADSMLQEHRSFPMLIDLADRLCAVNFGASSFVSTVQMAYAKAGKPFLYLGERETRTR